MRIMGKVIDQGGRVAAGRDELLIGGLDDVLGNQFPSSLIFDAPGVTHTLTVADGKSVQDRDFDDGHLLTWPSGDPKMLLVVIGVDETGERATFWVRGQRATKAFRKAYVTAEARGLAKGDELTITRGEDEEVPPEKKGGKPTFANTWDISVVPVGVKA